MFGIGSILGGIVSGVTSYFKGKQELKKVELEAKKKMILAKAETELAIAKAKMKMAQNDQQNDFKLDLLAMQNMEKSWKDEFILLLFSIPMILAFIPQMQEFALRGFEVIAKMPTWYQYTFIGMIVVIYGMRGMLRAFLAKKSSNFLGK